MEVKSRWKYSGRLRASLLGAPHNRLNCGDDSTSSQVQKSEVEDSATSVQQPATAFAVAWSGPWLVKGPLE